MDSGGNISQHFNQNISEGNISQYQELLDWNKDLSDMLIPDNVILVCYMLLAMGGNSVVLYVYKFRMKNNLTERYIIPILAATDLLAATVNASSAVAVNFMQVIFFNSTLCKALGVLSGLTTYMSVFILLIIAVQRYLKVIKPAGRQMDKKLSLIALLCAFVLSLILAVPTSLFYGSVPFKNDDGSLQGMRCTRIKEEKKPGSIIYISVVGLIAIVVNVSLIGIYSRIGWVIFRQTKLNKKFSNANIVSKSSTPEATLSGLQTTVVKDSSRTNLGEKERYNDRMIKCIPLNQNTNNTVKKNVRNTRKYEMKLDQHAKINKNIMHKFTLMFMLITFIFLICYIPKIVIMIVEALNPTFGRI